MLLGTGVLWELRPLKYFLVTNILHTATGLELHLILLEKYFFCGKCKNWESLWLLFFLAGLFYFSYHLLLWQVVDLLQYPMFVNFLVCFVMIFNVCKNCLENISKSCHYKSLNCFLVYHFYNNIVIINFRIHKLNSFLMVYFLMRYLLFYSSRVCPLVLTQGP